MAFLNARTASFDILTALAWALAGACVSIPAWADGGMVEGIDAGISSSAGPGDIYSGGGSLSVDLGDSEDDDNFSGDVHANYLNELSPQDSSVENGPLKEVSNWSGGANIELGYKWSLGLDFESTLDPFEQLTTSTTQLSIGRDPWTLSFRHGRNVINQSFTLPSIPGVTFQGAYIYQEMLKLETEFKLGRSDSLEPSISGSLFSPDANAFATLLAKQVYTSLSNFQDTLTSFELWSLGLTWNHEFSKKVQAELIAKYGYLIIGPGNSIETQADLSFPIAGMTTGKLGWQYTYDPSSHSNAIVLELHTRWEP